MDVERVRAGGEPGPAAPWWRGYARRRFGALLGLLVAVLAVPPVLVGFGASPEWFDGLLALALVGAVAALCFNRRERAVALALGVPTLVIWLGGRTLPAEIGEGVAAAGYACAVLFFFGAASVVVRALFDRGVHTFDSVLGAACGYLFLGLAWGMIYLMTEDLAPGSFRYGDGLAAVDTSLSDGPPRPLPYVLTYYSFVTLTTVGYGDVSPVSPAARTFAWLEAIAGQFYLAVIVAGLVSVMATKSREPSDRGG